MTSPQLSFDGLTKDEIAIERIKTYCQGQEPYLAFSGGKDSIVINDLASRAGIPFIAHYHMTGIDPPELVYFLREHYPDVIWHRPPQSIWQMIQKHGMPTRERRWCCDLLKEQGGRNSLVITGIRWAESARRRARMMYEVCKKWHDKRFLHPIIDWSNGELWDYIRRRRLAYCSLYDEGFHRLGCIGCPMTTRQQTKIEAARWPRIFQAWEHAALRFYQSHRAELSRWPEFQNYWNWWRARLRGRECISDAQYSLFE